MEKAEAADEFPAILRFTQSVRARSGQRKVNLEAKWREPGGISEICG